MPNKTLFRSAALEQLRSPDALDQLLQVTRPAGWLALLACALLLVAALLWGVFGSLPITVTGQGILLAPGGVREVVSLSAGQLVSLDVHPGDIIAPGQVVARLIEPEQSTPTDIISPYAGRVLELQAITGGVVERGDALLSLESADAGSLEAIVYIPAAEGNKVQPGMQVLLAPASVKQEEYGRLLGQVVSVGDFPASQRGMLRVLGSEELVTALTGDGTTIEVRAALRSDSQTPSGYAWSSAQGPSLVLSSGTLCTAWIETSLKRPISLLFP
ncbi:MAG: NHLP bacteriocin system secretion protein [Anaerolineae bacterium]|nr:NHLP bacteriocin system secretion protein [Anaerolineae bacterium]